MTKRKTIVINAHGKIDSNQQVFKLSTNLITTCKLGEVYYAKLLTFQEVSIFEKPDYLYKYILNGENYLNKGVLYSKNSNMLDVVLSPMKHIESVKILSWQKPYMVEHLTKLCRYELSEDSKYKNIINPFNINKISLKEIEKEAEINENLSLFSSVEIVKSYNDNYQYKNPIYIGGHVCSITYNNDRSVNIIDYEDKGLFNIKEEWSLSQFIVDLDVYANNYDLELSGAESIVLKACLSE